MDNRFSVKQDNYDDYDSTYFHSRNSHVDPSIKGSRSSFNMINDHFDSNITQINRQSSNLLSNTKQLLTLPIPTPSRNKQNYNRKQSVFSFNIISSQSSLTQEENKELKEHVKFLLSQIKMFNQINELKTNKTKGESNDKLLQELKKLRIKYEEFKINYDKCLKENNNLKEALDRKKRFDITILSKTHQELKIEALKTSLDLYSTINSTKSREDINKTINYTSHHSRNVGMKVPNNYNHTFYVRKVGLSNTKKSHRASSPYPIIEKKLLLNVNIECLFQINPRRKNVTIFNILTRKFLTVDYKDTCNFSNNYSNKESSITLNVSDGLFILTGKECRDLYFYDHQSRIINQLQCPTYSHRKGAIISYSNYLSEQKLIFVSGDSNTKTEMFIVDEDKWKNYPDMNNLSISSRIDTCYLIINKTYLFAFFGFDFITNKFIISIDYLWLSNPLQWINLPIDIQENKEMSNFSLRAHTIFNKRRENNGNLIYLFGGKMCREINSDLIEIDIPRENTSYTINRINTKEPQKNPQEYLFYSSLYEYVDGISNKKFYKFSFDNSSNVHIIALDTMKHNIISNPNIS